VVCPYAERRGPAVYCKAAGRKVNPLAFPCLTDKYQKCRFYRAPQATPQTPQPPRQEARPARPRRGVKGSTIDGRVPVDCTECVYYGSRTGTCILLGVTVRDPRDPPCAEG